MTSGHYWLVWLLLWAWVGVEKSWAVTSNQPPVFVSFSSALFLPEDTPVGSVLDQLRATDSDNTVLTFSIDGDIANQLLNLQRVSDTSADVILNEPFDKESVEHYRINFKVSDGQNVISRVTNLYVTDVNDNAPRFVGLPYRAEMREIMAWRRPGNKPLPEPMMDSSVGMSIFQVSATDPDSGILGLPSYIITTPQGMFSVDQGSGIVTLTSTLDYETEKFYQLEIMATDGGGLNSTTDLVINVIDVPDTAPYFLNLPYMASVVENVTVGTSVLQVTAQDGDRGISNEVQYSIVEGGNEYFSLDENTGVISIAQTLDREDSAIRDMFGVIDMTVQASEVSSSPSGPTTATALVTLTIEDVNDQTPTFSQSSYEASVFENTQTRIPITFLPDGTEMIVQDYDMGDMGRFRLFLEKDGQPYDTFEVVPSLVINEATVLLRVLNADALDYETTQTLTFQVVAQEHLTPEARTSRADVTVHILDMNDHWPMFEEDIYTASIPENSAKGTTVIQITATDADSGAFGEMSYRIQGSSADLFTIDETTGEITVAVDADQDHTLLDRETVATHYLTLEAIDGGGLRTLVQVIVTLSDVNDNAPSIARVEYEGYVEENEVNLERQLVIQATDLDLPPNSDITYELQDGDYSGNFRIDATSGEITLSSPLDYEAVAPSLNGLLQLHVAALDGGTPQLNGSALVLIHLQDSNDETPVFNSTSYSAILPENSQENTFVTQVFATDTDGTAPNNEIIYRIESGARDKFRIDGQTGRITVESGANLDRDIYGAQYRLHVLGIDRGTPSLTGSTTVTVTITDTNNKDPVFNPTSASVSIPENTVVGEEVYTYTATDADHDALLSYSLAENQITGEDEERHPITDINYLKGLFGIYANNGSVYVKGELNREIVEEITLVVMVEDTNAQDPTPQQATARLTVVLLDINDNAPIFIPSDVYTARISEASQPGIEVKQVLAIDSDETVGRIQYFLNPSPESQAFEITAANRETGVVTLRQQVNREQSEFVRLIVRAEDRGNPRLTGTATIEVTIEDVNDNSPQWVMFEPFVPVWENATTGTVITTVQATDADTGVYGEVKYYMTSGNTDTFSLNADTGVLTLIRAIDREEIDEYKLTIEARDNNLAASSDQRRTPGFMTIILNDVNDNPPVFDQPTYTARSVQENAGIGEQILTVHAQDADSGDNSQVRYSIDAAHSNASTLFTVGETSGIVTVAELLKGNVGWFLVTIRATDQGQNPLSGTTEVYVFIVDVNDHPPEIVKPELNAVIPVRENVPPGTFVVRVEARDEDEGLNGEVLFEFVENPTNQQHDWTKFTINMTTGNIYTAQTIDREVQEYYFLEVRAYDRASLSYDDRRTITIIALDVDDNEPKFDRTADPPPITLFAQEETNGTLVGRVNLATDPDTGNNSMVCYYLVGNPADYPYSSHFQLNKTSGALYLKVALDHEIIKTVSVLVRATHECSFGDYNADSVVWDIDDESLLLVEVHITDINDNGPVFTKRSFTAGVTRDTQRGEEVIDLSEYVTDVDGPNNQEHRFYIVPEIEIINNELRAQISGETQVFKVDAVTGIVTTNIYFQQNMHGYFILHLKVEDGVDGHEDTADASIYLLNEDQRAKVVVWGTPQEVAEFKDEFADYLSNITGYVINVDKIQTHRDALDNPDDRKTDMYIHAIHHSTGEVLDATVLIDLIDRNYAPLDPLFKQYNVIEIVPAVQVRAAAAVENVQLALIIIAALLFLLLVIVCATFFTCRNKYKRKLKAATAMAFDTTSSVHIGNGLSSTRTLNSTLNGSNSNGLTHMEVPGTNMHAYEGSNPIWLEQYENGWAGESDTESKNSIDQNALAAGRMKSYGEVEASLDMYNDEFDHYNQLPAKEADIYLTAALSHRDRYALMNGDTKANNLSNERMNGSVNHVNNQAHVNPAFKPDENGSGIIAHMHTSNI